MHKILRKEVYYLKGQHVAKTINGRMENIILSMAHMEDVYRTLYPKTKVPFQDWIMGDTKPRSQQGSDKKGCQRQRYIEALLIPIDSYHRVHESKSRDEYYNEKIRLGLITNFTEAELNERSYSMKAAKPIKDDEPSDKPSYMPYTFLQGKDIGITAAEWIDYSMSHDELGASQLGQNPLDVFIRIEEKECRFKALEGEFTELDIVILDMYLSEQKSCGNLKRKRGTIDRISNYNKVTRDKVKWTITKADRFISLLDEIDHKLA